MNRKLRVCLIGCGRTGMIHAIGHNFRSPAKAAEYPEYYDTCSVLLEFENGIIANITGAQYVKYAYPAEANAFAGCILNDTEPKVTGYDGKMALIQVNEGLRSILEKRPVVITL